MAGRPLVAVAVALLLAGGSAHAYRDLDHFTIDVAVNATTRWDDVCNSRKAEMTSLYTHVDNVLRELGQQSFVAAAEKALAWLPHADEMVALARCTDQRKAIVAATNLFYLLTAKASNTGAAQQGGASCITTTPQGVFHGHNFDVSGGLTGMTHLLQEAAIQVTFTNGVLPVFEAVVPAGVVYPWTGMKNSAFAVTGNPRHRGTADENIAALDAGSPPPSAFIRGVFSNANSFSEAVEYLIHANASANIYYVVSGVADGEGAVLAKGLTSADVVVWRANETLTDPDGLENPGGWYVVETNYDLSEAVPLDDRRRWEMVSYLNTTGVDGATQNAMEELMQLKGVENDETVYTVTMSAEKDLLRARALLDPLPVTPAPTPAPGPATHRHPAHQVVTFLILLSVGFLIATLVYCISRKTHAAKLKIIKDRIRSATQAGASGTEATTYNTFDNPTGINDADEPAKTDAEKEDDETRVAAIEAEEREGDAV